MMKITSRVTSQSHTATALDPNLLYKYTEPHYNTKIDTVEHPFRQAAIKFLGLVHLEHRFGYNMAYSMDPNTSADWL